MSWMALDARCRAYDRAGWRAWEHTRYIVAPWTGQKPEKFLPLPTDKRNGPKQVEPPSLEFIEEMRRKANSLLTQSK